jgi:hypothetical protein
MFKRPVSFPFHILLLPVFFVFHTVNAYYGLLPWSSIALALLIYSIMAMLVWLVGKLWFRSNTSAVIWTTGLLIPFLFFGACHDFLKSMDLPSVMTSYKVILPVLLTGYIAFTVYVRRTKHTFGKAVIYQTTLFIVLAGIEISLLLYNMATHKEHRQLIGNEPPVVSRIDPVPSQQAPDIFFIVFDEFASSASLEKYFNYSNTYLDSALAANHFFIARRSESNYNCTPVSIASTLDLRYLNASLENQVTSPTFMLRGWLTLKMSPLPDLLKKAGYDIYNFGVCDFTNYPAHEERYFADYEYEVLHGATLWGRIEKDILWNVFAYNIPFLSQAARKKLLRQKEDFIGRNRKNMQLLLQELNSQHNRPKFVFGHIMMPHAPFYFDRHGNSTNQFSPIYNFRNQQQPFLDQLIYTNTWVDTLAKAANRPFSRPRVVIIEGDHGYRNENQSSPREIHFMNLNSWYFSDNNYNLLYDSISPVNTFRVIFNKYFNGRLPILNDSTVYLR